jgi:7,8-dihydro-6-hydroxymethylpterin dimethyltransferase
LRQAWLMKRDLIGARGRVHKLTLFTHNFMDACALDVERIDACVFMAITQDGPLSMCAYNAQRDHYLLRPLPTQQGLWQPLREGFAGAHEARPVVASFPIKWLKGKPRAAAMQQRQKTAGTLPPAPSTSSN